MNNMPSKQKGFTLIEVIVTIIIAALMGIVVFTYLGNVLTRSAEPIFMVQDLTEAVGVMEDFAAKYLEYLKSNGSISWNQFTAGLTGSGVTTKQKSKGQTGTAFESVTFDVIEVTVTRNNQTVSALFTE